MGSPVLLWVQVYVKDNPEPVLQQLDLVEYTTLTYGIPFAPGNLDFKGNIVFFRVSFASGAESWSAVIWQ